MQRNLLISENPIKAVAELLSHTVLAATQMQETIKLMDIPANKWGIRHAAMSFAQDVQARVEKSLRDYEAISDALRKIGY